jgi:hypothetical protein
MISQKTKDGLEKTGLVLCFAGLFAILQPFSILLYQYGFQILCIGGFMYVAMGYVPANVRIPKAVLLVLSVLGVVVGFLLLGIVLTPMLI